MRVGEGPLEVADVFRRRAARGRGRRRRGGLRGAQERPQPRRLLLRGQRAVEGVAAEVRVAPVAPVARLRRREQPALRGVRAALRRFRRLVARGEPRLQRGDVLEAAAPELEERLGRLGRLRERGRRVRRGGQVLFDAEEGVLAEPRAQRRGLELGRVGAEELRRRGVGLRVVGPEALGLLAEAAAALLGALLGLGDVELGVREVLELLRDVEGRPEGRGVHRSRLPGGGRGCPPRRRGAVLELPSGGRGCPGASSARHRCSTGLAA